MRVWRVLVLVAVLAGMLAGQDVAASVDRPQVPVSSSALPADSVGYDDAAMGIPIVAVSVRSTLSVTCQAALPTREGQAMTWMALPSGGTPPYSYAWSGWDGLGGTTQTVSKVYGTAGWKQAMVVATDQAGRQVSAECGMHVMPAVFSEPPTVNPVLFVPAGVDPAPMVPQLERVWRSIRAGYYHLYGRTFRLNPLTVIVSDKTERELCGGDCTDQRKADTIVFGAMGDAWDRIGRLPYVRAIQVMVWGGGAWAGSYGWDYTMGATGDFATAPAAGAQTPALEPDLPTWLDWQVGEYEGSISGAIAHELNHGIGWDDPHDFTLETPPTDREMAIVLAGPWMTEIPSDTVPPAVAITNPVQGAPISGTLAVAVTATDNQAMDAVVLLVDGKYRGVDGSAPYSFALDTSLLGFGKHQISALAYDAAGNTSKATVEATVVNIVAETSCSGDFPSGTFHACFYDGVGFDGPYLGTMLDHPFPAETANAWFGIRHSWDAEIAFGESDTVTGVWRGTLDFMPGNYLFRVFADDGVRVWVDGLQVIDAWQEQVAEYSAVAALDGATQIEVQWYEQGGGQGLSMWWAPTRTAPPGQRTLNTFIGEGLGTIRSDPVGIDCGLLCYHSYPSGSQVTLNAIPDPGWVFDGWSGACNGLGPCRVAMTETRTVTAAFEPLPGAFGKASPSNGTTGQPLNPALSWGASSDATSYEYCYDTSNDGTCTGGWHGTGTTTSTNLSGLTPGTSYWWQVRAISSSGTTYANGGTWWSFTTRAPASREMSFRSVGTFDGWVLEQDAASGRGGSLDAAATTGRVGDDALDRQWRSVLHFDTATLPDDAVITGVILRIRKQSIVGGNPFDTHGFLTVDLKTGAFHDNPVLENLDFQAMGSRGNVGRFIRTPADGWYRAPLRASVYPLINLTGVTQFRLRYATDDNDDLGADYLSFYTGDAVDPAKRPELIVTYYQCPSSGLHSDDANTQLLLHFDGILGGTQGELATASGVSYSGGRFDRAVTVNNVDMLWYPAAGNIVRTQGAIEFWVRPHWDGDDGAGYTFFEIGNTWFNRMRITKDGANNLRFMLWDDHAEYGVAHNIADWAAEEWHHVAVTWAGSEIALYVDGVREDESFSAHVPVSLAGRFFVGSTSAASGSGAAEQADADLDEFRISDVPRVGFSQGCWAAVGQ